MPLHRRSFLAASLVSLSATGVRRSLAAPAAGDGLDLVATSTSLQLTAEGPATDVLRFAGPEPMTVLRLKAGETRTGIIRNELAQPTSLQWHGLRGRGSLDDPTTEALQTIAPGASLPVTLAPPDSGTSWFHPNAGDTNQTGRGLAGVLIVAERDPPIVDHDLVCFLADWNLDAEHRLTPGAPDSTVVTLSNHRPPSPLTVRPGARLRLRLINGSVRRVMVVGCEGARPKIVAIDGQPSELFEPSRGSVPIGPGARFDWIVDAPSEPGKTIRLIVKGTEKTAGGVEPDRVVSTIGTEGEPLSAKPPIAALPSNPALPAEIKLEAAKRVELTLAATGGAASTWSINGVSGIALPAKPILKVRAGDAVTLGFANTSGTLVALRVHGQALRLLHDKDDGWDPYWRESVLLPPMSRSHVAFVASTPGRWLIQSAINSQAVAGLRCWFEVSPS